MIQRTLWIVLFTIAEYVSCKKQLHLKYFAKNQLKFSSKDNFDEIMTKRTLHLKEMCQKYYDPVMAESKLLNKRHICSFAIFCMRTKS